VRRILTDVIAPELTGAYPVDMLRGVLANLEMLERSWTKVAPFLTWDNAATERLLDTIAPLVDEPLATRILTVLRAAPAGNGDADALDARNTALRDLLADAVPALAGGEERTRDVYDAVRAHLRVRMDRFPLAMNAPMPGSAR
jgi:hypothetical protein